MQEEAATGREVVRHSSIAHSISSMCSKYSHSRKSIPSSTNTLVCFLHSCCTSALAMPER